LDFLAFLGLVEVRSAIAGRLPAQPRKFQIEAVFAERSLGTRVEPLGGAALWALRFQASRL